MVNAGKMVSFFTQFSSHWWSCKYARSYAGFVLGGSHAICFITESGKKLAPKCGCTDVSRGPELIWGGGCQPNHRSEVQCSEHGKFHVSFGAVWFEHRGA